MPAIDFPISPTNGQTLTSGDKTWVYSTTLGAWSLQAQTLAGPTGPTGSSAPKSVTIFNPTAAEKTVLFFTTSAITISQIRSVVFGTTPSVTFSIRYGTDVSGAGVEVVTGGITVTNTTTGLSTTTFNSASITANNFVWITTSAISGTITQLSVSLIF